MAHDTKESGAVFDALDVGKNGTLSPSELTARLSDFGLASELIDVLFYRLDTNHDGQVSKQEFVKGYGEYLAMLRSTALPVAAALPGKDEAARGGAFVLTPTHESPTAAPLGSECSVLRHPGGMVTIHKSTYEANAPSEDRSSVVLGEDFIFAGVWDGHGGTACSEHIEGAAFPAFAASKAAGRSNPDAWADCYASLDSSYLQLANSIGVEAGGPAKTLFAGACCTGAFVDLRPGLPCPADQHELLLHSAADLAKTGWGRSDPYCLVTVNGANVGQTPTRSRTQSPKWQASIQLRGMLPSPHVNTVRVEIRNRDRVGDGSSEGVIEFVGVGLSAFDGCRGRLGSYPVTLEGAPAGSLTCQLQVPVPISVGNLGDSRAVLGVYESGALRTQPMSCDHSVCNPEERARIENEHPPSENGGVGPIDEASGRVKKICAFTRSIGDCQMKDPTAAALFNSYGAVDSAGVRHARKNKVEPRPGTITAGASTAAETPVLPYISCIPEHQDECLCDGFLIVACDGVWDEITSEEAVQVVSELLAKDKAQGGGANIADQFIEVVLQKVVERVKATFKSEKLLTLQELKARPQGSKRWKGQKYCRSCLHDDITAVILHFTSAAGGEAAADVAAQLAADEHSSFHLALTEAFAAIDYDKSGKLTTENIKALGKRLGRVISTDQASAFIAEHDRDGTGNLLFDEFAVAFEHHAWKHAQLRQGGEGTKKRSSVADEVLLGLIEAEPESEPEGNTEKESKHEDSAEDIEPQGRRRTASDCEIIDIFKTLQSATSKQVEAAASLQGLATDSILALPQLAKLLQGLHASVVGAYTLADDKAAMLAAQVCVDESVAVSENGISVAQLSALVARNVPG